MSVWLTSSRSVVTSVIAPSSSSMMVATIARCGRVVKAKASMVRMMAFLEHMFVSGVSIGERIGTGEMRHDERYRIGWNAIRHARVLSLGGAR